MRLMTYLAPTLSKLAKKKQFYSIKTGTYLRPEIAFFFFESTKKCLFLQNGELSQKLLAYFCSFARF